MIIPLQLRLTARIGRTAETISVRRVRDSSNDDQGLSTVSVQPNKAPGGLVSGVGADKEVLS